MATMPYHTPTSSPTDGIFAMETTQAQNLHSMNHFFELKLELNQTLANIFENVSLYAFGGKFHYFMKKKNRRKSHVV